MADSAGGGGGGGEGVSCASPSSILLRSTVKSETRMTPPPPPTPPIEVPLKEEQSPWDTDTNCDFIVNGDEVDVHQDDRAMTLRTNGASSGVADLNGKPSSSSSSTQSPEIVAEPAINPGTDGKDDGDCSNDGSSSSSSEGLEAPKPMEGLKEVGTPPFLKKTYEMVEDPDSDAVVSWGVDRKSFVVWNPHEFSDHLLPKYFKHRNFSSFIRQLNTYGFRKVDPNRWEFANEGFQGGKKHLLKNIKRRSRVPRNHREPTVSANIETPVAGADAQIQTMKNDQDALLKEILKLRQQQETSEKEISTVEERIRRAECRHQQMILFLARAVKSPSFVDQLIQKRKQKREIDAGGFIKKRKLLDDNLRPTRSIFKGANIGGDHDCHRDACGGGLSEMLPPCSNENSSVGFSTPTPDENFSNAADQMSDAILGDLRSFYHAMSEKLLDDRNLMCEGGNGEQMDVNDSKIYLELECLIGMPREWDLACGGISADDLNPCKETTVGLMP